MRKTNLETVILDLLEASSKNVKVAPMNLGGVRGPAGGFGGPPGGFIGTLPQTRVSYDEDEIAFSGILYSGASLLDNLNHIRYRLDVVESGGGGEGGIPEAPNDGETYGRNSLSWVDLDSEYLRLDATNDPITGRLVILTADSSTTLFAENDAGGNVFGIEQYTDGSTAHPAFYVYRTTNDAADTISSPMIYGSEDVYPGNITGPFILYQRDGVDMFKVDIAGKAYTQGELLITDAPIDGNTYGRNNSAWVVVSGGPGGGDGSFNRNRTADFTLASGYSLVTVDYLNMDSYDLILDGDSTILILEGAPGYEIPVTTSGLVTNGDYHDHIGGDGAPITEGALNLSDVTTGDSSTTNHGFLKKLSASAGDYMAGNGNWTALPASSSVPDRTKVSIVSDFLDGYDSGGIYYGVFTSQVLSNGSLGSWGGTSNHPGYKGIYCGTSTNSGLYFNSVNGGVVEAGGGVYECIFNILQTSNLLLEMGMYDAVSVSAVAQGIWFYVSVDTLQGKTVAGGSTSTTSSSYTLSASTWYRCKLVVNSNATLVTFYLYDESGTQLWSDTLATTIPTVALPPAKILAAKLSSSGGATEIVWVDWLAYWSTRTLVR